MTDQFSTSPAPATPGQTIVIREAPRRSWIAWLLVFLLGISLFFNLGQLGMLLVGDKESRKGVGPFRDADRRTLGLFANQAAIALENARLHRQALEKERLEREMELAADIQRQLLPTGTPWLPGFEFSGWNRPTWQVGGDYYDFLKLGGDRLGLLVADVTVVPVYDHAAAALTEVRKAEAKLAVAETEAKAAVQALIGQEAVVQKTRATDYVARDLAVAPLRALAMARDIAVKRRDDAREGHRQATLQLSNAVTKRRAEVLEKRALVAEMVAELDRQDSELNAFEAAYIPSSSNLKDQTNG